VARAMLLIGSMTARIAIRLVWLVALMTWISG
jgi:hypothetical protein